MRRLFDLAALALIVFMVGSLPWLPGEVGDPGKTMAAWAYLAVMLPNVVLALWLCSRGLAWTARRHPGLMNMPHKDYWLAEPRREASIAWLAQHGLGLGWSVVLVFVLAHYCVLQPAMPGWPRMDPWAWFGLAGLLLAYVAFWSRAFYKRFPAPPANEAPARSLRPRRPYRS